MCQFRLLCIRWPEGSRTSRQKGAIAINGGLPLHAILSIANGESAVPWGPLLPLVSERGWSGRASQGVNGLELPIECTAIAVDTGMHLLRLNEESCPCRRRYLLTVARSNSTR